MTVSAGISESFVDIADGAAPEAVPVIPSPPPGTGDPVWRWSGALERLLCGDIERGVADADPVIAYYLEPYFRVRCGLPGAVTITEVEYLAVHAAVRLYSDKRRDCHPLPYHLEAGIVAGLEVGAAAPPEADVDPAVQWLYEAIFFSTVREHLHDREWLLRNLFSAPWQTTRTAAWGFRAKLYAHVLGRDGYAAWREGGAASARARRLAELLPRVMAYLRGLEALGIAHSGDPVRVFRWMLGEVERGAEDADFWASSLANPPVGQLGPACPG